MNDVDRHWMQRAFALAEKAQGHDEVPVGAVLVQGGELLGEGANAPISQRDPTAHAEINAIRAACKKQGNYRLPNSTLYVTLEPCAMCAGAIVHARIERVVIAASEPRAGAAGSVLNVLQHEQLNHRCDVEFGLMRDESATLLRTFFSARRKKSPKTPL